jgi:hypothetical protein
MNERHLINAIRKMVMDTRGAEFRLVYPDYAEKAYVTGDCHRMTEREIRGLFTLLELSLNQTIDGLRATLNTIDQYKRGEVRLPELQEKLANAKDMYHQ